MIDVPGGPTGVVGGVVTVVLAVAGWLRYRKPAEDRWIAANNADTGIIERLERECTRLSVQNDKLAENLNAFQLQLLTFQTENQKLSLENSALREENLSLREEIVELRREVQDLGNAMLNLKMHACPRAPSCAHIEHVVI